MAFSRARCARASVVTSAGSSRQRRPAREAAHVGGAVRARKHLRRVDLPVLGLAFDEQGVAARSGRGCAGSGCGLSARRPSASAPAAPRAPTTGPWRSPRHRPRSARRRPRRRECAHHRRRAPRPEAEPMGRRAPRAIAASSMPLVNSAGCTCAVVAVVPSCWCTIASRATQSGDARPASHPEPAPGAGHDAERLQPPIPPAAVELARELGVELEAPAREWCQRRAVRPSRARGTRRICPMRHRRPRSARRTRASRPSLRLRK